MLPWELRGYFPYYELLVGFCHGKDAMGLIPFTCGASHIHGFHLLQKIPMDHIKARFAGALWLLCTHASSHSQVTSSNPSTSQPHIKVLEHLKDKPA